MEILSQMQSFLSKNAVRCKMYSSMTKQSGWRLFDTVTPNGGCSQSSGNAVTCIIRGASVDLSVSCKYEYFLGSCLVAERRYIFAGAGEFKRLQKSLSQ